MKPGTLVLLDGSDCYYKDGQWLVTVSTVNVIGDAKDDSRGLRRTCRVGLLKVLCNQINLFANRYAIVTKLKKNTSEDPKVLETTTERVETQTVDGVELQTEDPPQKKRKKSTGKPLSLKKLLSMIEAAAKKEVLANPEIATVDIVTANFDVAYVTLLDGGVTINQPRVQATMPAVMIEHPDPIVHGAHELLDKDISGASKKRCTKSKVTSAKMKRSPGSREAERLQKENSFLQDADFDETGMSRLEARNLRKAMKDSKKSHATATVDDDVIGSSSTSSSSSSSSNFSD